MIKKYLRIISLLFALTTLVSVLSLFGCADDSGLDENEDENEDKNDDENIKDDGKDEDKVIEDLYNGEIPEDTEYVIANGVTKRMIALSGEVKGNRARLARFMKKAQNGEELTVAFVGGSITMGGSADKTSYDLCFAAKTTAWLQEKFPSAEIKHLNLGLNSTGSYINIHRLKKELFVHNPDLVFVDFSVNDTASYEHRNVTAYDNLIRNIWLSDSSPAIVAIGMTAQTWSFQEYHAQVCKYYQIPMISYANAINDVIEKGYIKWTDISDDDIHPNVTGHGILSELISAYLQSVIDNLDSIDTEKESDFSKSFKSHIYKNADIISPADVSYTDGDLWKVEAPSGKTYNGGWYVTSEDGSFDGVSPIKIEVNAKRIGLLFKRYTADYASFEVYIDGKYKATIDPKASYSFRDCAEIATSSSEGTHVVEIVPKTASSKATVYICAILVS